MRVPGKIDREEGLLSLDFIIGFTIFMVALIFVAIMISGLLVHLQSRTIDYDAVAYRTSVVLVEDPGEPAWEPWTSGRLLLEPPNWHLVNLRFPAERATVRRLGLAISKNTPGILQYYKIEKFFNSSISPSCANNDQFCYPDDYRTKLIFGDYPYQFNITLESIDENPVYFKHVGQTPPDRYGYIKRIVKIKYPSSMEINEPGMDLLYNNTSVHFNFPELYEVPPDYRIDPINENLTVHFSSLPPGTTISSVRVCVQPPFSGLTCYIPLPNYPTFGFDATTVWVDTGYFRRINLDEYSTAYVKVVFTGNAVNQTDYWYNMTTADIPDLSPAVLEVKIW